MATFDLAAIRAAAHRAVDHYDTSEADVDALVSIVRRTGAALSIG
jgi:hypothetical protein